MSYESIGDSYLKAIFLFSSFSSFFFLIVKLRSISEMHLCTILLNDSLQMHCQVNLAHLLFTH